MSVYLGTVGPGEGEGEGFGGRGSVGPGEGAGEGIGTWLVSGTVSREKRSADKNIKVPRLMVSRFHERFLQHAE